MKKRDEHVLQSTTHQEDARAKEWVSLRGRGTRGRMGRGVGDRTMLERCTIE